MRGSAYSTRRVNWMRCSETTIRRKPTTSWPRCWSGFTKTCPRYADRPLHLLPLLIPVLILYMHPWNSNTHYRCACVVFSFCLLHIQKVGEGGLQTSFISDHFHGCQVSEITCKTAGKVICSTEEPFSNLSVAVNQEDYYTIEVRLRPL